MKTNKEEYGKFLNFLVENSEMLTIEVIEETEEIIVTWGNAGDQILLKNCKTDFIRFGE